MLYRCMWPGCDYRDGTLADAVVHFREAHGYTEDDLLDLAAVAAWTAEEWNSGS